MLTGTLLKPSERQKK